MRRNDICALLISAIILTQITLNLISKKCLKDLHSTRQELLSKTSIKCSLLTNNFNSEDQCIEQSLESDIRWSDAKFDDRILKCSNYFNSLPNTAMFPVRAQKIDYQPTSGSKIAVFSAKHSRTERLRLFSKSESSLILPWDLFFRDGKKKSKT